MITRKDVAGVLEGYDAEKIRICTLGSHSALQIAKGAKEEGLRSTLLCTKKAADFYRAWPCVDEVVEVGEYKDVLLGKVQDMLIERNAVIVPHGSFVEYVGAKNIIEKLKVPMQGNRLVLEWESDRKKQFTWFRKAGARLPREYKSAEEIDGLAMVKFPGAKGGSGYFLAKTPEEFGEKIKEARVSEDAKKACVIQEYVVGTRFYPHFFYSPLDDSLELLGMDIRYESNIDGLARVPSAQGDIGVEPSYVVAGNIPVVMRESLLPGLMELARSLVETSKKLFSPGMLGPFCIELVCTDKLEFVCFEVSARIVAGTNVNVGGSPYSWLRYDEPMSCGRRIAREIKVAAGRKRLAEVVY